jgi:APA family basic amino acid/polyamine antiporter
VVLTILYGQPRIMVAMSRDGLVPRQLSNASERTGTPVALTARFALFIAAVVPLTKIAELVNIGTLFAFVLVTSA